AIAYVGGRRTRVTPGHEITQLLQEWSDGDRDALEKLTPLVHKELHQAARRCMAGERAKHTLQTTALINQDYVRLLEWKNVRWQNRAHFFALASRLMRHILVDFARSRRYNKRGAGWPRVSLDDVEVAAPQARSDIIALDRALTRLAAMDPRKSQVVELRFF